MDPAVSTRVARAVPRPPRPPCQGRPVGLAEWLIRLAHGDTGADPAGLLREQSSRALRREQAGRRTGLACETRVLQSHSKTLGNSSALPSRGRGRAASVIRDVPAKLVQSRNLLQSFPHRSRSSCGRSGAALALGTPGPNSFRTAHDVVTANSPLKPQPPDRLFYASPSKFLGD